MSNDPHMRRPKATWHLRFYRVARGMGAPRWIAAIYADDTELVSSVRFSLRKWGWTR